MNEAIIICHGGAGHGASDQPGVDAAADAGAAILGRGGTALEAVLASVVIMEDDPRLNAGTGGRLRSDGSVQLDAAVATCEGGLGLIMAVEETPNPVLLAAELLGEEFHILAGRGARQFADSRGIKREEVVGSPRPIATDTVGAIARDADGRIAVASSTGGCTGRPAGRVGDTPMWGSGLWCEGGFAIAATGIGEEILKQMLCHRVAIESQKEGTELALDWGISLFDKSIEVGLIAIGPDGAFANANTGMPWAIRTSV